MKADGADIVTSDAVSEEGSYDTCAVKREDTGLVDFSEGFVSNA